MRGAGAVVVCATTSGGELGLGFSGRSSAVDISGPDLPPGVRYRTERSCRPQNQTTPDARRDATDRSEFATLRSGISMSHAAININAMGAT